MKSSTAEVERDREETKQASNLLQNKIFHTDFRSFEALSDIKIIPSSKRVGFVKFHYDPITGVLIDLSMVPVS